MKNIREIINLKALQTEGEKFGEYADDWFYVIIDEYVVEHYKKDLTDGDFDYLYELKNDLKKKIINSFNNLEK